ncbi:sarcosine oxidase subunit gamma family protein [Aliiroseovarius subalbicans]|uniref:sarcosine oxidase subunit gamma n=1 Tax=Aliiroseovarius subalbicans TaxID=2925840 RepID=UPI001F56EBDC|nr:sarcosine oxidase subunit gamma family protein [Aliiroseovarius subalbicans]MCI2398692.1 sarcosine oxidase subunit gamma [Aliiroseovarius subalbicans]
MSNAVSALDGATYQGFCKVQEMGLVGMITLRGDLGAAAMAKAVKAVTGVAMPGQGAVTTGKGGTVAWMSPDELLVMVDHAGADAAVAKLSKALAKEHALAVNVSDARAVFHVTGQAAREVMAKLSPADVSALAPGIMRRTRLAQVAGAFHMLDEGTFEVVCFRSVAGYVFDVLANAAKPGSEVGVL